MKHTFIFIITMIVINSCVKYSPTTMVERFEHMKSQEKQISIIKNNNNMLYNEYTYKNIKETVSLDYLVIAQPNPSRYNIVYFNQNICCLRRNNIPWWIDIEGVTTSG